LLLVFCWFWRGADVCLVSTVLAGMKRSTGLTYVESHLPSAFGSLDLGSFSYFIFTFSDLIPEEMLDVNKSMKANKTHYLGP
jgi:hypothetical protein